MPSPQRQSPQDQLREYVSLEKRRTGDGITPLEYLRWIDLGVKLREAFPKHPMRASSAESRVRVEFRNSEKLHAAVMLNVRPIGIYVHTPFAAEIGTQFELVVCVKDTADEFRSRVEVISNNVGPEFSTALLGMGLRFRDPQCELRAVVEQLCDADDEDSVSG